MTGHLFLAIFAFALLEVSATEKNYDPEGHLVKLHGTDDVLRTRHFYKDKIELTHCDDCSINLENYVTSFPFYQAIKNCLRNGFGLVCDSKGHHWICADDEALAEHKCHQSYYDELEEILV